MNTHTDKTQRNKSQSVAGESAQKQSSGEPTLGFIDNRPEAVQMRKLQEMANNSPQAKRTPQLQATADNHSIQQQQHRIQKKENNTGLPDNLKSGIENLSGYSMDDVKVHYNSDKPAQFQAYAFAHGSDIYLGPGQVKHLPHEAWHVVQQAQGKVQPTMQMKGGVSINDDLDLEKEADVMGNKALQESSTDNGTVPQTPNGAALSASTNPALVLNARSQLASITSTTPHLATVLRKPIKLNEKDLTLDQIRNIIQQLQDWPELLGKKLQDYKLTFEVALQLFFDKATASVNNEDDLVRAFDLWISSLDPQEQPNEKELTSPSAGVENKSQRSLPSSQNPAEEQEESAKKDEETLCNAVKGTDQKLCSNVTEHIRRLAKKSGTVRALLRCAAEAVLDHNIEIHACDSSGLRALRINNYCSQFVRAKNILCFYAPTLEETTVLHELTHVALVHTFHTGSRPESNDATSESLSNVIWEWDKFHTRFDDMNLFLQKLLSMTYGDAKNLLIAIQKVIEHLKEYSPEKNNGEDRRPEEVGSHLAEIILLFHSLKFIPKNCEKEIPLSDPDEKAWEVIKEFLPSTYYYFQNVKLFKPRNA